MRNPFGVTLNTIPDPCTFSDPGDDTYVIRELVEDDDGFKVLKDVGKQSISVMINAYKDTTDMTFILSRLAAGDASVLNVVPLTYGDVSDMPHDHRAALTAVQSARTYFDHLDDDIKAKFDNDFSKWFSQAGDDEWIVKMTKQVSTPVVEQSEVSE